MKTIAKITLVLLAAGFTSAAQQTIMYTQYAFNKAGLNPAASGTEINQEIFYAIGVNRQWIGFANAPKQNFVNFSYTIKPPRSYRYWQNAGVYVENDDSGLLSYDNFYGSYTFHLLLRKTMVASFGVYAGMRSFSRSLSGGFDPSDPAVAKNKTTIYTLPDIIPGFRLSDKKFFMDVSIRQLTVYKMQDFKGRRIGSPSRLKPSIYFDYGRKISLSDYLLMMPSFAVNLPVIGPPLVDANVMFFYSNTFGAGISLRNLSSASAIVQVRFYKSLSLGVAYSYPLGALRQTAPNSLEVMLGIIPLGMNTKVAGKHSIAKCPALSY
ncbi:MAG: PorP/SprF family type IX secretion system membrane protein [Bacteroidia bacterium]|nr:PorP/SprF family type IX secretion system membrane protein [Bacteroidia bacterium]